jgi:lipid II:glycine glycyltransferase (peptidoglycan interpeptide bridge formation enzyme)
MPELLAPQWEDFLASFPEAHILQTRAWGDLKAAFGWKTAYVTALETDASLGQLGAQILFRRLPLGLTIAYIGKGPVGSEIALADLGCLDALWREVDSLCRRQRAVFLKLEPDQFETGVGLGNKPGGDQHAPPYGFRPSPQTIQPRRTLLVDTSGDEELVLSRMKQKTRYNIRLAAKKGVRVHPSTDLETFQRLMLVTGERDMFGVHSRDYYQRAYNLFQPRGECVMLLAEYQGEPLSALMAFARGRRAWYFYGASGNAHRERMPTYLLQWEAMRWARARGCISYDLWGVPDFDESFLEAHFSERNQGLWGVYRFKRGFGGQLLRTRGPWDRVYNPALYALYRWRFRNKAPE